ncbi:methyltransferase type 12 [Mariannaea sp. PMI_226]|nr:methyltransferase type 12 [Mariannaea sp. PMI_226]
MNYETLNKAKWDERAPVHAASRDYQIQAYITNPDHISNTVKFDQSLLGDIFGLKCVHLQCHIGTDTLSLSRLGATSVTGLDFSSASLEHARNLAAATHRTGGERLTFVEASVYDGLKVLQPGSFDLVFTGIGSLCWIPSIKDWARVVSGLLKPAGRLFIREGHPVLWAMDRTEPNKLVMELPYFERSEPVIFDADNTYVETDGHKFTATKSAQFNHGLGEIIQALLSAGLRISGLTEHQSVPWPALPAQMKADDMGEFSLIDRPWRMPHSYTLQAIKE